MFAMQVIGGARYALSSPVEHSTNTPLGDDAGVHPKDLHIMGVVAGNNTNNGDIIEIKAMLRRDTSSLCSELASERSQPILLNKHGEVNVLNGN